MAKQVCEQYIITVRGVDLEDGLDAAVNAIKDGNIEGAESGESGGYYFKVRRRVPKADWPN